MPLLLIAITLLSRQQKDSIAILRPIIETTQLAGTDTKLTNPVETADRVIPKLEKEGPEKLKWDFNFIPYDKTTAAEDDAFAGAEPTSEVVRVRKLGQVAKALGARYVVFFKISELSSYHAMGLIRRQGGRANITLTVYDDSTKKYVWQAQKTETTIHAQLIGGQGSASFLDQSLFNALNQTLTPFMQGQRKVVETVSTGLIAKVSAIIKVGDSVLLDLGESSGIHTGDVFTSLDGTVSVTIKEVLGNGSIATITTGTPDKDMILKSG